MTDIKVGDVVVLNTSRPNSMNDLRTISSLYENGKCAVTTDGRKIRLLCGDFKVHIHATPAEIAAGHRIDATPNATISPPRHDLPQDGAMVHDREKEAVNANERCFDVWLHALYEESPGIHENKFIVGAQLAWQHQQAVVDSLTAKLERSEQSAKEHIRLCREKDAQLSKQWDEKEELQKRVEAVESTLRALRDKASEKFDAACAEQNSEGADHWSGHFTALDTALHSLGFKDSYDEQALGADHETP